VLVGTGVDVGAKVDVGAGVLVGADVAVARRVLVALGVLVAIDVDVGNGVLVGHDADSAGVGEGDVHPIAHPTVASAPALRKARRESFLCECIAFLARSILDLLLCGRAKDVLDTATDASELYHHLSQTASCALGPRGGYLIYPWSKTCWTVCV
jgi:hypothetical protein